MEANDFDLNYAPAGPTVREFHLSNELRRLLMGPIGSGKSVAGCFECMRRAFEAPVCIDGKRRSRIAIIRNTFGDLERTTLKTWQDQFADAFGKPVRRQAGIVHHIVRNLSDGTTVDAEFLFFSMDRPQDVKRLLSLELTAAFVNESREIPKQIFEALDDRCGRYPSKAMLPPGTSLWYGWWADTNPPDKDHWIYQIFEVDKPDGWRLFHQPGGVIEESPGKWVANPRAENLHNLTAGSGYYTEKIAGKSEDHISVYYGANYGYVREGRLVISNFSERLHASNHVLEIDENIELVFVGLDFGATPAAAFLQQRPNGQWQWIREIQSEKTGMHSFCSDQLRPALIDLKARKHKIVVTGDPAGGGDTDDAPFRVAELYGIKVNAAYTNAFETRMEVLRGLCNQLVDGQPAILVSHSCRTTRRGLANKFIYKKVGVDTTEGQRYQIVPDKNEFSHCIDAGIYAIMGAGERVTSSKGSGKLNYKKLH